MLRNEEDRALCLPFSVAVSPSYGGDRHGTVYVTVLMASDQQDPAPAARAVSLSLVRIGRRLG